MACATLGADALQRMTRAHRRRPEDTAFGTGATTMLGGERRLGLTAALCDGSGHCGARTGPSERRAITIGKHDFERQLLALIDRADEARPPRPCGSRDLGDRSRRRSAELG